MHIICPPKFGISFFFDYFFWDGCNTLEKWKAKVMQNFWGQINCIMGDVYVPNRFCLSCLQLFRERFRKNVHATIPKGIGMLSNLLLLFCFSTRRYVHDLSRLPFFQISLKNSELKTTHNTFPACRVHFIWQPCTAWRSFDVSRGLSEIVTFCDNFLYRYSKDDVAWWRGHAGE